MRLNKRHRKSSSGFNMTPMIDIVFLLIIFFMTVTQVTELNKERMDLPKLKGAEDQKPTSLTINVNRSEEIIVSGVRKTLAELVRMVSAELAAVGDDPSRISVLVRADKRPRSKIVNDVMKALGRMQIKKVRISVESPR